jgi:hypothetical protein
MSVNWNLFESWKNTNSPFKNVPEFTLGNVDMNVKTNENGSNNKANDIPPKKKKLLLKPPKIQEPIQDEEFIDVDAVEEPISNISSLDSNVDKIALISKIFLSWKLSEPCKKHVIAELISNAFDEFKGNENF